MPVSPPLHPCYPGPLARRTLTGAGPLNHDGQRIVTGQPPPLGGAALFPEALAMKPEAVQSTAAFLGPGGPFPQEFGRYLVRARLGGGGMGTVYLALDRILDIDVAL